MYASSDKCLTRRGSRMRRTIGLALGILLVAASTTTSAFEEQQMKAPPPAKAEGSGVQNAPKGLDGKTLDFKAPESKPETGTKIRIPGLGVIGEIPKIDLGLDLLYGATDPKRGDLDRNDGSGVILRGKIPLQR